MAASWLYQVSPVLRPNWNGAVYTGHAAAAAEYLMPRRIIYDHEVILYAGSRYMIETEDEQIILEPDSYVILPPAVLHGEFNTGRRPGHRWWCHFDWTWQPWHKDTPIMTIMPGAPRFDLCRPAPEFVPKGILHGRIGRPAAVYAQARRLAELMRQGDEGAGLKARAILLQLLVDLLAEKESEAALPPPRTLPSRIRKRLDAAVREGGGDLGLERLLDDLGYSYEHLSRVFRAAYGVSPMQYIRARQLSRAQFLLRNTDTPVGQIGYLLGFNSPAYFTKIFHQAAGQTPGAFRAGGRR